MGAAGPLPGLLAAIAARPEGEKLRVADLARQLGLTQADVITIIELLIADGRLEAVTLRPPAPAAMPPADASTPPAGGTHVKVPITVTGPQLYRLLRDEGERRGLLPCAVSDAVFGNRAQMSMMKSAKRNPREGTRLKAEAWLNHVTAADLAAACPPRTVPAKQVLAGPSGPEFADEIEAWLTAHPDLIKSRVTAWLGMAGGDLGGFRRGRQPTAKTVQRIRGLLAGPVPDTLGWGGAATPRVRPARRDPTAQPDTPLLDMGDRRATKNARIAAGVNRAREQHAARLVDAGADPTKQNSFMGGQMRSIIRRREDEARAADPVEQAKLALRRRGRVVFDASVHGGAKGRFIVSGMRDEESGKALHLTAPQLIALAQRVNPQAAPQIPTARASQARAEIMGRALG